MEVVSGKEFFAKLNHVLMRDFKIAVSVHYAATALRRGEIDKEIGVVAREFTELMES